MVADVTIKDDKHIRVIGCNNFLNHHQFCVIHVIVNCYSGNRQHCAYCADSHANKSSLLISQNISHEFLGFYALEALINISICKLNESASSVS